MGVGVGTVGGGEILRAILDDQAVHRQYALYNAFIGASSGAPSPTAQLRGSFQCRSDRWFLMTGVFPFWTNGGPSRDWQTLAGAQFIEINDATNQARLIENNVIRLQIGLMNEALNARMTLPEYVLWPPNALINFAWVGTTTAQAGGNGNDVKCLVLEGIEYLMGN